MDTSRRGTVILLNGASSSGKSSLARQLQQRLPGIWVTLGIDSLAIGLPALTEPSEEDVQAMARALATMEKRFRTFIAEIADQDVNVILDWVCQRGSRDHLGWKEVLGDRVLWVNVFAPLAVLEERERARGDRGIGLARFQFPIVHDNVPADLVVDTSVLSTEQAAEHVAEKVSAVSTQHSRAGVAS